MSRDRLEDLGRLAVIIDSVLDHPIFNEDRMKPEHFEEWFWMQEKSIQDVILKRYCDAMSEIEPILANALKIANGLDALNGIGKNA